MYPKGVQGPLCVEKRSGDPLPASQRERHVDRQKAWPDKTLVVAVDIGCRVQGLGSGIQGLRFRGWGLEFRL